MRQQLLRDFRVHLIHPALQRGAGGFAMLIRDVAGNHADRGGEYGGVIGEAEDRHHVGNEIKRQDEIGDRPEQRRLDMARRLPVEGAVIGGEQILRERQLRGDTLQLAPEAAAHALTIFREPVGRLETNAVFGSHGRQTPRSSLGWQIAASRADHKMGTRPVPARRQPGVSLAMAFIAVASSMSSAVTPPASWVASTTSTVL